MKTDISRLDEKPVARLLSRMRVGALVAAALAMGAGLVGFAESEPCWDMEVEQGVRVVRASVTWREGGKELSVVHVAEPVQPGVVVIDHGERRRRFNDMSVLGREIRTAVGTVMMVVRLLAQGRMDG